MTAAMTDLITKVGQPGSLSSLTGAGKLVGVDTMGLSTPANFPTQTAAILCMRKVNITTGEELENSYTVWKGIVNGSSVDNMELQYGSDQEYPAGEGTQVFIYITTTWANSLVDGLLKSLNPDGTMKGSAVKDALGITGDTPPDWTPIPVIPTVVSNDGAHQHKLRFAGVDYTPTFGPGVKFRLSRSGTTPTKSALFNGTTHYAVKTSPAGMTTTGAFTVESMLELPAYRTDVGVVFGRFNSAGAGWMFRITAHGNAQVYFSTSGTNFRQWETRQAIPTGVETHVAIAVDSVSGTPRFYFDGSFVPCYLSGTAGTAGYSQSGDLYFGARDDGAGTKIQFLNAYVSEARYWTTGRTEQQIRDNAGIQLVGNETGLAGYWTLNNTFNDLTANANSLTANGGVVATADKHPFSANEFAIVTDVKKVGADTEVLVFSGENVIPNAAFSSASYSTARAPFGFPAARTRWRTRLHVTRDVITGIVAINSNDYMAGLQLPVPVGVWRVNYSGVFTQSNGTAAAVSFRFGFTTTENSENGRVGGLTRAAEIPNGINTTTLRQPMAAEVELEATEYTRLYMWAVCHVGNSATLRINAENDRATFIMFAECAYL